LFIAGQPEPRPLRIGDVAAAIGTCPRTVTASLGLLERLGLVTRDGVAGAAATFRVVNPTLSVEFDSSERATDESHTPTATTVATTEVAIEASTAAVSLIELVQSLTSAPVSEGLVAQLQEAVGNDVRILVQALKRLTQRNRHYPNPRLLIGAVTYYRQQSRRAT
jgi:hypothetical protein